MKIYILISLQVYVPTSVNCATKHSHSGARSSRMVARFTGNICLTLINSVARKRTCVRNAGTPRPTRNNITNTSRTNTRTAPYCSNATTRDSSSSTVKSRLANRKVESKMFDIHHRYNKTVFTHRDSHCDTFYVCLFYVYIIMQYILNTLYAHTDYN